MSLGYSSRAARVAAFGFVALLASAPAFAACGAAPTAEVSDGLLRLKTTGDAGWFHAVVDSGSAVEGDFVYDGTNKVPAFCNGTSWVDVATSGGSLPALTNDYLWVGNGSNVATAVQLSQDVTITNAGVATVGKIQNVSVGSPTGTAGSAVVLATSPTIAAPTLTGTTAGANLTLSGTATWTPGSDYTTTGAQNNVSLGTVSAVRYTGAGTATFTGIVAGSNLSGQLLLLHNASGSVLTLSNQSASSTAANRIITGTGADLAVANDSSVGLQYDGTASRWRVTGGTAGASSAIVLISTQTASNSASLQFTALPTTYNTLWLNCTGLLVSADGNYILPLIGEGAGPTWETGAHYTVNDTVNGSIGGLTGESSTTWASLLGSTSAALSTFPISLKLYIDNVGSSSLYKNVFFEMARYKNSSTYYTRAGSGYWNNDTNAVTGIEVTVNAGTITSGQCSLYGMQ
jgi:hypothetical protein